jgi:hypothetical protein
VSRESYTPGGIAAMKRRISVRAIDFWVWEQADQGEGCSLGSGGAGSGYEFATDHGPSAHMDPSSYPLYHYRYPPVAPSSAGARPVVVTFDKPDSPGHLGGAPVDVWATYYHPWFEAVEQVFEGWDALPDERDFWPIADNLEAHANPIEIDMDSSTPTRVAGNAELAKSFNDLWNARMPLLRERSRPPAGGAHSKAVDVFYDTYAAGLDLVIGQQAVVLNLLAASARTEGDLWHRARATVMEIGEAAVGAMGPEHLTEAQVAAVVNVIGDSLNVFGFMPEAPVSAFADVVGLFCDGLELYWKANPPPQPTAVEKTLAGATPDTVLDKLRDALSELDRQIVEQELSLQGLLNEALDQSHTPSNEKGVGVNLPPPQLLNESDPAAAVDSIYMDYPDIREAAHAMGDIATRLSVVPVGLDRYDRSATWLRPAHIGVNETGPYSAWSALLARAEEVIPDTAGELEAASDHLLLAVDLIERADDGSRAAFDKHLRETADVRAPEAARPPREEPVTPVGGPRP